MRVVVAGAGMGGLVLAQALARAGDDVEVYERDVEVGATGGYRLHLNEAACAVLERHLDPLLVAAIWASSAAPDSFRQFAVTDHRLRVLALDARQAGARLLIGRVPLRRLLCRGLQGRVHFGVTVVGYSVRAGGVEVRLADGSHCMVDLLVGADGVGSVVARTLAGRPTAQRLGLGAIAGRTFLPVDDPRVPPLLRRGPALAVGPGGLGMFLTLHQARTFDPVCNEDFVGTSARVDAPRSRSSGIATTRPHPAGPQPSKPAAAPEKAAAESEPPALIWAVLGVDRHFPCDVRLRPEAELPGLARSLITRWHPTVRELVDQAAAKTAAYFSFSAADPTKDLTPWTPDRVVALGDAVHAMPPTGGQAAATAIRDAGVLADQLGRVRRGELTLPAALAAFQTEMAAYAPAAVAESLRPVRWIRASSGRVATVAACGVLPAAAAVSAALRTSSALLKASRSR